MSGNQLNGIVSNNAFGYFHMEHSSHCTKLSGRDNIRPSESNDSFSGSLADQQRLRNPRTLVGEAPFKVGTSWQSIPRSLKLNRMVDRYCFEFRLSPSASPWRPGGAGGVSAGGAARRAQGQWLLHHQQRRWTGPDLGGGEPGLVDRGAGKLSLDRQFAN